MKGLDGFKDPEWSMLFNTMIHVEPYHRLYSKQVLHGCLQFMSLDVRLSPLMNANPMLKKLGVYLWNRDRNGTKTNLYDPYAMGYRRAAQATIIWGNTAKLSKSAKVVLYEL